MRFAARIPGNGYAARWLSPAGGVRSVQRGTIVIANASASNTATIAAVSLANTRLVWVGTAHETSIGTTNNILHAHLVLTNETTITATRSGSTGALTVGYEVIEYEPGVIRSIQRGTIVMNGVASNTATVARVNTSKASLDWLGMLTNDANADQPSRALNRIVLTNATTVTATREGVADNSVTASYQLVEWA